MNILTLTLLLSLSIHASVCLPDGAPTSACGSMQPRHLRNGSRNGFIPSQPMPSIHNVITMVPNYSVGQVVRVWIDDNSGMGYRGILLQARAINGQSALGKWQNPPNDTKLITCVNPNDTITHSNTMQKNNMFVYEWIPSRNFGDIQFVATVAERRRVFWVQLKSEIVRGNGGITSTFENICGVSILISIVWSLLLTEM